MSGQTKSILQLATIGMILTLCGCTPEHTRQSVQHYSQQFGASNQYTIQSWHNRIIPRQSSILVASQPQSVSDVKTFNSSMLRALQPQFSTVDSIDSAAMTLAGSLRAAKKSNVNFLLHIQQIDVELAAKRQEKNEETSSHEPVEIQYSRVSFEMALVDVVSGQIINKFVITAKPSYLKLFGDDLSALLANPLDDFAAALAGG